jgi:ficolin
MDHCVKYPVVGSANGQRFSTKNQDNDRHSGHCAESRKGGWWYNACCCADFNKLYSTGMHWLGWSESIKKSIMMIRRTQ